MSSCKTKIDIPLLALKLALLVLVFLLGGLSVTTNLQPLRFLHQGYENTILFAMEALQQRPSLLDRKRYPGSGVVRHTPGALPGFTVLQGLFPGGPQLKLVDISGNELHSWNVDFWKVWPSPEHLPEQAVPKSVHNYHLHGMVVNPDGSVIVNVDGKGTVKLSRCGEVIWTIDRMTHHSITSGLNGGYWIPEYRQVEDIADSLLFTNISKERLKRSNYLENHGYEHLLLFVDEKGNVKREFSVLQALYDAGFERILFDALAVKETDPVHVNDVEVVTAPFAQKVKGVEIGDLLVSLRQMHMLIVMDQSSGVIKWHYQGPWIRQHDPDITPQGNVVVFNNGRREFSFHRIPGSNLIMLDPASRETAVIYPQSEEGAFYTDIMGEHQTLENGNRLIVESRAGRVFEVDKSGDRVWDYRLPYDENYASLIESAARYPANYFSVEEWACN